MSVLAVQASQGRAAAGRMDPLRTALAARAKGGDKDPAMKAARLLESLFVRQLVQALGKKGGEGGALFGKSVGRDIFQQMFKGAVADKIYEGGGLGLAKQLVGQLRAGRSSHPVAPVAGAAGAGAAARAAEAARAVGAATAATPSGRVEGQSRGGAAIPSMRGGSSLAALGSSPATGAPGTSPASAPASPLATRELAQTLRAQLGRQRARAIFEGHAPLGGVAFESPERQHATLPRDRDAQLWSPLGSGPLAAGHLPARFVAPAGSRVAAAASGRVLRRLDDGLVVGHAGGRETSYRGLGVVSAQAGDLVLRGQELGRVGREGLLRFSLQKRAAR